MRKKAGVFRSGGSRLARKQIGVGEMLCSALILALLVLVAAWFFLQRDAFDPAERDIDTALLAAGSVEDTLYRAPLEAWVDPAQRRAGGGAPDLGRFPAGILDQDWALSSRVQRFSPETLYEKINGAAEQYLQYGFAQLDYVAVSHAASESEVGIELYDMGRFENALGIFVAQRDSDQETAFLGAAQYYGTQAGLMAIFGQYYLKIAGSEESEIVRAKALALFKAIASGLEEAIKIPQTYTLLTETLGIPANAVAFERSDVFQYDFAKNFWFGSPSPEQDLRYFLHEAEDPAAATTLFNKLVENNRYDYTLIEEGADKVIMQHQFLKTFMVLNRREALVFGLEGAASSEEVNAKLTPLIEALKYGEDM